MPRGRKSGRGMIGGDSYVLPAEHHMASNEERANRDKQTHQMPPTSFHQIGPEDSAGKNMAKLDQEYENKSGSALKFSGFGG